MNKTIIIAEAGVNHNGDLNTAKELIDVAKEAGADYVKFQTFKAETIVSKNAKKANYQIKNTNDNDSQFKMLKNLELSNSDHEILINYCKKKNIQFFSTAFDLDGVDYLDSLGLQMFKIPSGEITNYPYLKAVAKKNKPIILSTGMATLLEIEEALNILLKNGAQKEEVIILHCNSAYPTPLEDVNLKAMLSIRDAFGVKIGYSDHSEGIEVSIAAVALGAIVIEKHFTLDRNFQGPDHKSSLEPDELKSMIKSIRNIEIAISGNGKKEPSKSEKKNIDIVRKSIYLKTNMIKGQKLKEDNLIMLRPGDGVSPMKFNEVINKIANKDLLVNTKLNIKDFD
jgi:N-acetylneuraminate synthase/N,N'-diacetyllegionaminate synthase